MDEWLQSDEKNERRPESLVPAVNAQGTNFDNINECKSSMIIKNFHDLGEYNKQNSYLAGLITLLPQTEKPQC